MQRSRCRQIPAPCGVTGISENTRLNKALWALAEEMRKLVAA
jgi:hypothetical protein